MFNKDDYMTVADIMADFKAARSTVTRWIAKGYLDKQYVEVHGGQYYIHKDEVNRWKAKLGEVKTPIKGRKLPGPTISLLQFIQ